MANNQTTLSRILAAVQAYKAAGAGFNTLLGVFLESPEKDSAEALKQTKGAYADAFASAYQGVTANKDSERRTLWAGWTTYTSDASELSSLLKLGREHVQHAFNAGMGRNAATAYRAGLVKAATDAALIKAMADAPAATGEQAEVIEAAPAPAGVESGEAETDSEGTIVALTVEGVRFVRESVLIATIAELNAQREQVAALRAELATMQAAKASAKAPKKAKQAA